MRKRMPFSEIMEIFEAVGKADGDIVKAASIQVMKPSRIHSLFIRHRRERAIERSKENNRLVLLRRYPSLRKLLEPSPADHRYAKKMLSLSTMSNVPEDTSDHTFIETNIGTVRSDVAERMIRAGTIRVKVNSK